MKHLLFALLSVVLLVAPLGAQDPPPVSGPPPVTTPPPPSLPPPGVRPTPLVPSPTTALGWRDFRGVIHAHSHHSHDSTGTTEEIEAAAVAAGIDFLCMTDHPTDVSVPQGLRGWRGPPDSNHRTLFLVGEEIGCSEGGSILTVNARERTHARKAAESAAAIHAQGGLLIAGHAEDWTAWDAPYDALEVYNIHYDALLDGKVTQFFARALPLIRRDADAAFRVLLDRPDQVLGCWDRECRRRRVPGIAGNDSHRNVQFAGVQLDPYERSFRFVNTHVFVKELTAATLLEAIREGRAYFCHEMLHPGAGFSLTLRRGEDGPVIAVMGEERPFAAGLALDLQLPVARPFTVLRDGAVWHRGEGARFTRVLTEPGVYRVEATFPDSKDGDREKPWLYSNPIYLRPAAAERTPAPPPADGGEEF